MKNLRTKKWLQTVVMAILLPSVSLVTLPVMGNPTGGVVVNGSVQFHNPAANHLQITQSTNTAIINWQDFSIAAGETTQFIQPNSSAAVLNRVVTGNPSAIYGSLLANGNVFVVNPNGIVVGAGGVIDVGGSFVASTLDIDNDDFISGGANRFYGDSQTGVTNFGTITSRSGDVILLGGFVDNQGQIGAMNGTVALGSGGDILISEGAGSKITVQGTSDYTGTGINNDGVIRGASAELKSHGNVYALAINNGGAIRASGATRANGRVRLTGTGGSSNINLGETSSITATRGANGGDVEIDAGPEGDVSLGGAINVAGQSQGGTVSVVGRNVTQTETASIEAGGIINGGSITLDAVETTRVSGANTVEGQFGDGGTVDVMATEIELGSTASINADGDAVGGRIRVGGEFQGIDVEGFREADNTDVAKGASLTADSTGGDAGSVIVWANNDTMFLGDVSASASGVEGNGGLIEISGKNTLYVYGKVRATSINGRSGTVLLDPGNIQVGNFGGSGDGPAPRIDGQGELVTGTAPSSNIEVAFINDTLQSGTSVILATQSGSIFFLDIEIAGQSGGGSHTSGELTNPDIDGVAGLQGTIDAMTGDFDRRIGDYDMSDPNHPRNYSIQWTNSDASFGAFASGSIFVDNHIRTSGGGSINLMAGWTGTEADSILTLARTANDPENAWNAYLNNGQFGIGGGSIIVGDGNQDRHISVGSRFGNTNLAGTAISISAADTNGESRWVQIGFSDSGQIFAPRFNRSDDNAFDFDLNDGSLTSLDGRYDTFDPDGPVIDPSDPNYDAANPQNNSRLNDNNPVVGIAGMNEVDIDGDGLMDGVYGVNRSGVLDGTNTDTGGDATFIPYAIHYNSSRTGNWWWHHIDADNPDPSGLGGLRPEHGAGVGALSTVAKTAGALEKNANINIVATRGVSLNGGGRSQGGAYIGHGGDASGWADQRSVRDVNDRRNLSGQTLYAWTVNGSTQDRVSQSIARLAPVYGNINVLAGVDPTTVSYNRFQGTIDAEVTGSGSVILTALQRLGSSNNPTNDEQASGSDAPVLIGHGGTGQFGSFYGDIDVRAGGNVELNAGSQSRGFAQIGHSSGDLMYWDPTNNANNQIRFFGSIQDFDDPLLRRGELFSGSTNIAQAALNDPFSNGVGDGNVGRSDNRDLSNPDSTPDGSTPIAPGPVTVAALDGSVLKVFSGNVNVEAGTGDVIVKAYNTEDKSVQDEDGNFIVGGVATNRERRFAMIGHGGVGRAFSTELSGYSPGNSGRDSELVQFRLDTGGKLDTGAGSVKGEAGTALNRSSTFMSLLGDISVTSGGDVTLTGGSDFSDFTKIGHGGIEVADYETSSIIAGNIDLTVGGDLNMEAGGAVIYTGTRGAFDHRTFAQVGHGGYRTGFFAMVGDIEVDVTGDITITGGSVADAFAKIGHQGKSDHAQVGGNYVRGENYFFDGVSTDIDTSLGGTALSIAYTTDDAAVAGDSDHDQLRQTLEFDITSNTANINVEADGDITLNHLRAGPSSYGNQAPTTTNRTDDSFVQIGHGGHDVDAIRDDNTTGFYDDKIGDITVMAGNDILLSGGNGDGYYTRIGHGGGDADRVANNPMILGGRITVVAENDITMDGEGRFGDFDNDPTTPDTFEFESDENIGIGEGGNNAQVNPIQIGHGGTRNNLDVVVVSVGEQINGFDADSTITVTAGRDLTLKAGVGATTPQAVAVGSGGSDQRRITSASFTQIGHGFASDLANDRANINGVPVGFTGDINVSAGRDIWIEGSSNAHSLTVSSGVFAETIGAFSLIGNGGFNLDAPASGDISVYAGRNLDIVGGQRVDDDSSDVEGALNFAKIGHLGVENGQTRFNDVTPTGGVSDDDAVTFADMTGSITVVVDNDLTMRGGDIDTEAGGAGEVFTNFAQIGHGGPGVSQGDLNGNITILVHNDLTTIDGFTDPVVSGENPSNNYVQIGHGDWLRDANRFNDLQHVSRRPSIGDRIGDITVATGRHATFDHTLVGHADPAVRNGNATTIGGGITRIAVSRNNPFFGGTGTLTAENGTVFTSEFYDGDSLQFFMPARSNNAMDDTTRLNQVTTTFVESPDNFVGLDRSRAELAGREDEVYLRPDLWWDDAELGLALGFSETGGFPESTVGAQGGIVALVDSPGGITNVSDLVQGSLGTSADITRGDLGYTLFFDAIQAVPTTIPTPPIPPIVFPDFDFSAFVFLSLFDEELFDQLDDGENGLFGDGEGLFGVLGLEGEFGEDDESSQTAAERGLDSLLGDSRTPFSDEEDEEEARREDEIDAAASRVGGLTFYTFDPGTNRYSSYRVFGSPF